MTTHQFPKRKMSNGAGTIGVISGELTRYSHFAMAMLHLQVPEDSKLAWDPSANITGQCNALIKHARATNADWLWIIGDDHVFDPMIIHQLLAHEVDVVVPYCLQRSAPFNPVVYKGLNDEGHHEIYLDLPQSGLAEIFAAGSAGMLVRKHVIDALPERPFITTGGHQNEDLEFCAQIRAAGFKIWVDMDSSLAHVGTMIVWPQWMEEHGWGITLDIGPMTEDGQKQQIPVRRVAQGPSLTAA